MLVFWHLPCIFLFVSYKEIDSVCLKAQVRKVSDIQRAAMQKRLSVARFMAGGSLTIRWIIYTLTHTAKIIKFTQKITTILFCSSTSSVWGANIKRLRLIFDSGQLHKRKLHSDHLHRTALQRRGPPVLPS